MLLVSFVFLNLFIAIILEGFNMSQTEQDRRIKEQTFNDFVDCWKKYDPDATELIAFDDLENLIFDLTLLEL